MQVGLNYKQMAFPLHLTVVIRVYISYDTNNIREKEQHLMRIKILSLIAVFSIVLSAPISAFAATPPITPISPISNIKVTVPAEAAQWLAGSVEIALKHDLIPENLKSKYSQPLTRAEFSSLVVRVYEKIAGEEIKVKKTFTDTKSTDAEKVAGLEILSGIGNGKFDPNAIINREQVAVAVKRMMDKLGYKFYISPDYQIEFPLYMNDYDKSVSSWAKESMVWLIFESMGYGLNAWDDTKAGITLEESLYKLMRVFRLTNNNLMEGYTDAQEEAKKILNTFRTKYPTGMAWGNEKKYRWMDTTGYGCAAFAGELTEAVFGELPVHTHSDFEAIKIGDVLIINGGMHAAVAIDITEKGVVVAEGNLDGKVNWGSVYTKERFMNAAGAVHTRYPVVYTLAN
jgi:hypothetical protein